MKHLILLHIRYLLSEKVLLFTVFLLTCSSVFLLYSASLVEGEATLLFYKDFYAREFTSEMLNYGKLLVMVYLLFVMIISYVIHQYDVIMLNRTTVFKLKLSKILAMLSFIIYFTTIYFMVFVIVGLYLTPYMKIGKDTALLYIDFIFFGSYYTLMFAYLFEICRHLLGFIGGFLAYLFVFISSVNGLDKSDVNALLKYLYYVGPDMNFYPEEGFTFYYSKMYYLALLLGVGTLVYFWRKNGDVIN